jgi:hypothetical protein
MKHEICVLVKSERFPSGGTKTDSSICQPRLPPSSLLA